MLLLYQQLRIPHETYLEQLYSRSSEDIDYARDLRFRLWAVANTPTSY